MYMSQGAVDTRAVMTKWLQRHPTADPSGGASDWFDQLFPRAHDLLAAPPVVVPSTQFGLLENVLSQLAAGVSSKKDVVLGLARGLGFTLDPEHRKQFVSNLVRYVVLFRSGANADKRQCEAKRFTHNHCAAAASTSFDCTAYLTTLLMACTARLCHLQQGNHNTQHTYMLETPGIVVRLGQYFAMLSPAVHDKPKLKLHFRCCMCACPQTCWRRGWIHRPYLCASIRRPSGLPP